MRNAKIKSIGLVSFKKAAEENKLTLYHELQEDEYFRQNPQLIEFKKKGYREGADALQRGPKTVPINELIKDSNGFEFGRKFCLFSKSSLANIW